MTKPDDDQRPELTPPQRRALDFILNYVGAPNSKDIAESLGADLHGTQLILAELSQMKVIRRSKRGLYRVNTF